MSAAISGICRKTRCANLIPPSLASEQICLDHFLDEAFGRTAETMQRCHAGQAIEAKRLEQLLADALTIVTHLEGGASDGKPEERDRILELLLSLANLHEYAAHHAISLGPAS